MVSFKKFLYRLYIFYIASLLSYSLVLAQTRDCSFSDSEVEGVEVGQIGDRKIYTLFATHLTNERDRIYEFIQSYESGAIDYLNQLIEQYQSVIESEQSSVRKIVELIESKKIDWIGLESATMDNSYFNDEAEARVYLQDIRIVNRTLSHSYRWNMGKIAQLLSLFFPAPIVARANHPEIFQRVRIYPLEDRNLKIETEDRIRDINYQMEFVKKDPLVTETQYSEIHSFFSAILNESRLIPETELEDFLNRIGIPEEPRMTRINIRMVRLIAIDIMSLFKRRVKERGTAVAQSASDLSGNGLVLFREAHGPSIKQGFITACQNGHGLP